MSYALKRDQVPEYLSQLESSAWFLKSMRDRQKPGSPAYDQFNQELRSCEGQAARLKAAADQADQIS